ncbi:hypothetical protein PW52_09445 [Tamlana sedimentorum]|uniref:Uncharacterized protein n=1 Tax=Neotamlana sedimentorum TaxID=1435349 RepID=A0A0D7WB67_9FLAO|nr:hypothetical protein [Tamlana sedimentorum]KJD35933.1 hypothetical protein PW52_09445 [Tamlana sedimentorum]
MKSKTLIITSGSSQLITQISVLRNIKSDFSRVYLLYIGVFSESLEVFFKQMSKEFSFIYIGQIHFNINPIMLSKKEFIPYFFTGNFKRLFNLIDKNFSLLKDYKNFDLVLIPVRVKMMVDTVLLSYLKPKKTIFIADGVVDILPKRNLKGWYYYYLKNTITSFPIRTHIYSPYFLKRDIQKIGIYQEVEIDEILIETNKIELSKRFEQMYLRDSISHVILSQHYHLHEGIEFENDISYYKRIIKYALQNCENSKVLFKPHPRDVKSKIENLQLIDDSKLLVVKDEYKSLPIELFGKQFKEMRTVFLTGNSSAPLYFNKSNSIISVCSEKYLHKGLNNRIKEFAKNYTVGYLNL